MLRFPFLAVIAVVGVAAPAQDTFPLIPASHQAYEMIAKLKAAGILVRYSEGRKGNAPLTREEAAEELLDGLNALSRMVNSITDGLRVADLAPRNSPGSRLAHRKLDPEMEALRELKRTGLLKDMVRCCAWLRGLIDSSTVIRSVETISRQIDGVALPDRTLPWTGDTPRRGDTPDNHWFYEYLRQAGAKLPLYKTGPPLDADYLDASLRDASGRAYATPEWQVAAAGYIAARELKSKVAIPQDHTWLRLLIRAAWLDPNGKTPQFTDVPAHHWASDAVLKMREQGVFIGDGKGKFKAGG